MIGATLMVCAALLLNPALQEILSKPLFAFCGRISFSVYAMHLLLLGSNTSWLFLRLNGTLNYDISCIVCAAVSLASLLVIAYMVVRCVDEPVPRAANKIGKLWFRNRESGKGTSTGASSSGGDNRPDPTQPAVQGGQPQHTTRQSPGYQNMQSFLKNTPNSHRAVQFIEQRHSIAPIS